MSLEFLHHKPGKDKSTGAGDVRRLGMPEIQQKPESKSQQLFEALKKTALYNAENDRWNLAISREQERLDFEPDTLDQLLAVYLESLFNAEQGRDKLKSLEELFLLGENRNLWRDMNINEPAWLPAQFMGLILEKLNEAQTGIKSYKSRFHFNDLKDDYYDPMRRVWRSIEVFTTIVSVFRTKDQLYAAWAQVLIWPEEKSVVEEKLALLKSSGFYDQEGKHWLQDSRGYHDHTQIVEIETEDEFLELLITLESAPQQAYQRFQELKAGPLYDTQSQQWNQRYDLRTNIVNSCRTSRVQLLGIILEQRFEELFPATPALAAEAEKMPVEKNF